MGKDQNIFDTKIAYRERGQGEVLILLHGFGGSVLHWEEMASILSTQFRVIVPNLSHLFMGRNLSFSQQIQIVGHFIKTHFPNDGVHVAGISYGAAIAWGLSVKHPELIKKAVFINPMPPQASDHINIPVLKYFFRLPLNVEMIYQFLRLPVGKIFLKKVAEVFRTERVDGIGRLDSLKGRKLMFVSQMIFNFSYMLRNEDWTSWSQQLNAILLPTLMIYDGRDPLFKRSGYIRFASQIRCKELLEVTGAGHIAIQKEPVVISAAIESFIKNDFIYQAQGF